jgi:hypothetical protein
MGEKTKMISDGRFKISDLKEGKMKKLCAGIFLILAMSLAGGADAQMVWKTANQMTVAWDAATLDDGTPIPPGSTVQYQVYIRADPAGTPLAAGNPITNGTQATVTFTVEGQYDIGVEGQRLLDGQIISRTPIGWSNDPAIAQGGKIFGEIYYRALGNMKNLRESQGGS